MSSGPIYFDGLFSISAETGKAIMNSAYPLYYKPRYEFDVVEISESENAKVSDNLRNAIIANRKAGTYLFKKYRKEKDYDDATLEKLVTEYKSLVPKLNVQEKAYLDRYAECFGYSISR